MLFFSLSISCTNDAKAEQAKPDTTVTTNELHDKLKEKADTAFLFCKQKELNTDFCILIDMSVHSGKYRMFIWDFKNNTVSHQSLCAHGYGKGELRSTQQKPVFSNVEGSYCTSLGKYKTGAKAYSQYGINVHYKLYGFEKTNNNAFKRWIVLHSHTPVPSDEIYPQHMPLGWSQGCPVTDNTTMRILTDKLANSKKPVLLWIYI